MATSSDEFFHIVVHAFLEAFAGFRSRFTTNGRFISEYPRNWRPLPSKLCNGNLHSATMVRDDTLIIRIILVHDYALLREAIRVLINTNPDMQVIGEVGQCTEVLSLVNTVKADVIVINLPKNRDQLLDVLPALTASYSPRVLLLAERGDWETTRLAIRLGASGVVNKDDSGQMLTKALRRVHAGELWLNRSMTAVVFQDLRQGTSAPTQSLSPREQEIVALVAQGMGTRKLATCLHISEKTVRNHLSSIYEKLGVSDRVELALLAVQQGLTQAKVTPAARRKA